MSKVTKEQIDSASIVFSNGVRVVNTTPHPLNFLDNGKVVECPSNLDLLINASSIEKEVAPMLVKTSFEPNEAGKNLINEIRSIYPNSVLIGSMIACNAYPEVVGMVPAPGFERVPPSEKRMSTEKFNAGEVWEKRGLALQEEHKKYKLGEPVVKTINGESKTVCRIQALEDFGNVQKGEYGGWVSGEHNLSQSGDCWIRGELAYVLDDALVTDNAIVTDSLVEGECVIKDNAKVQEGSALVGAVEIKDETNIKQAFLAGDILVRGESNIKNSIIPGNCNFNNISIVNQAIQEPNGELWSQIKIEQFANESNREPIDCSKYQQYSEIKNSIKDFLERRIEWAKDTCGYESACGNYDTAFAYADESDRCRQALEEIETLGIPNSASARQEQDLQEAILDGDEDRIQEAMQAEAGNTQTDGEHNINESSLDEQSEALE